jgi:DNA helicase HerA-like ATPase
MSPDGESANRGLTRFPHLGSRIYSAPSELLRWLFESSQMRETGSEPIMLNLGSLPDGTEIRLTPERLFGRHCAVLGATGTGKSWTLARLIEDATRHSAKVVLFDATGEFQPLKSGAALSRSDRIRSVCAVQTERPESGRQITGSDQAP